MATMIRLDSSTLNAVPFGPRLGVALALAVLAGCGIERMSLPSVETTGLGGISDTTYLMLNSWIDLGSTTADPSDVFINDDGHVYVAESGTGRITVWNQALLDLNQPGPGEPLGEPGLEGWVLPGVKGVCIGPEQTLFACNGDSNLWAVNLLANRETVYGAFTRFRLTHNQTQEVSEVDAEEFAALIETGAVNRYQVVATDSLVGSVLDSLLAPHVFYEGSTSHHYDAVAKGRAGKREVFVVNNNSSGGSEIMRVRFRPEALVMLADDFSYFTYLYRPYVDADDAGSTREEVIGQGTGQATILDGLSLDLDDQQRLYYTQPMPADGGFRALRLAWSQATSGKDEWSEDPSLEFSDLYDPLQLNHATDITWSRDRIFVVDKGARHVQVFNHSGKFERPLGASRVYIDTTLTVDGAAVDTVLKSWRYDQLLDPTGVAVFGNRNDRDSDSEETVFVTDQGGRVAGPSGDSLTVNDRILLFTLSLSQDDLPAQ